MDVHKIDERKTGQAVSAGTAEGVDIQAQKTAEGSCGSVAAALASFGPSAPRMKLFL